MSKWLITGAAGFIGSNLCDHLLSVGQEVTGVDNFLFGKRENIDRLLRKHGNSFVFQEADITNKAAAEKAANGSDIVVHLAAQVSVQRSMDDPLETDRINVHGFLQMLQTAKQSNCQKFIFASSCAVYGDNTNLPLKETEHTRPMSPYAASKYIDEVYVNAVPACDMSITGLRFFNVFGPWQDANSGYAAVIPKWISILMSGEQPVVFGDGSATRDFCYVDNIAQAISKIGSSSDSSIQGVFNIGTGVRTKLIDLYQMIVEELANHGYTQTFDQPRFEAWNAGDILHSYSDISLASETFGFQPSIDLRKGIQNILTEQYKL